MILVVEANRMASIHMHMQYLEDRIWSLRQKYTPALNLQGYWHNPKTKPYLVIGYILKMLKSHNPKTRTNDIILWRKDENIH